MIRSSKTTGLARVGGLPATEISVQSFDSDYHVLKRKKKVEANQFCQRYVHPHRAPCNVSYSNPGAAAFRKELLNQP